MMTSTVTAELVAELPDLLGDDPLVSLAIDANFEPIVAAWHSHGGEEPTIASWARELGIPHNADLRIHHRRDGRWSHIDLDVPFEFPLVDRKPDDGWLVVDSRSIEPEHNAKVFDTNGVETGSFHAGDAIVHVQVTSGGRVWVGNFDEMYSERSELSEGLICLDTLGRPLFRYLSLLSAPPERPQLSRIDDLYALNVASSEDTWLFYYSDFPLVHLSGFEVTGVWSDIPRTPGAKAFAVADRRVLFAPGYNWNTFALVDLLDGGMSASRHIRLVGPNGKPVPVGRVRMGGRGPRMYVAADSKIWSVDVRDLS